MYDRKDFFKPSAGRTVALGEFPGQGTGLRTLNRSEDNCHNPLKNQMA